VTPCEENRFLTQPTRKSSIFMSVFNVHVNRIPLTGRIAERHYFSGKFFRANLDKASELNEHNALVIETPGGVRILAVQIAGLIARRIVCHLSAGDEVTRGSRFGMIRFGSRMDIYLPENARIAVRPGQKVHGGETILGTLP
jgi:phosphatidylserine decarboxylase